MTTGTALPTSKFISSCSSYANNSENLSKVTEWSVYEVTNSGSLVE